MPTVKCPCGVRLRYTRTHNGWREQWTGREASICTEISAKLQAKGKISGDDMVCDRMLTLIQADIHR